MPISRYEIRTLLSHQCGWNFACTFESYRLRHTTKLAEEGAEFVLDGRVGVRVDVELELCNQACDKLTG